MANTRSAKPNRRLHTRRNRFKALGSLAPKFSIAIDSGIIGNHDFFLQLPFRRSWIAILISAAFLAAFSIPLFSVGGSIAGESDGGLFSLVFVLFSLFWMLGWSVGVGILALVFVTVAFGRETLRIREDELILRIGIPGIGFGARYQAAAIRNFRRCSPDEITGTDWRGDHLAFDYAGETIGFGSAIADAQAQQVLDRLIQLFPDQSKPPLQLPNVDLDELLDADKGVVDSISGSGATMAGVEQAAAPGYASLSSMALLGANLIPLLGVLFDDWNIGEVMLLFWAESAVIGFYTLCKMWKIGRWSVLFYGPFFVGHYGAFMVGHLLFIYGLFSSEFASNVDIPVTEVLQDFLQMAPVLLAFFISHGISYYSNFLGRQEYRGREISEQMGQPYKRIVIMHVTIIFGGFLVMALNTPLAALLLLIVLKMGADLKAHQIEHALKKPPG